MSKITEVTAEAFEKLKLKPVTVKQKIEGFAKIKDDTAEVNKRLFCAGLQPLLQGWRCRLWPRSALRL